MKTGRRIIGSSSTILAALLALSAPATASQPAAGEGVATCAVPAAGQAPRVARTELAGVPATIRVPATISAPPILLWHGFGPPASEEALMALLPLDEVPAVKVYLGLPLFGARAPDDPGVLARRQAADMAGGVFEPVVMGAARELPAVVGALRRAGCLRAAQGINLFGFSAGGAAVLYALAEREVPVRSAVVLNASTGLSASVAAYERATGRSFEWTRKAREIAGQSDGTARAADIAAGSPPPALLIVQGAEDGMLGSEAARALHRALLAHHAGRDAGRIRLEGVEGMPHAPGAPADAARIRTLVGEWFLRHAPDDGGKPPA